MAKRLSILLMVLLSILLVSACSSSNDATTGNQPSETTSTSESAPSGETSSEKLDRLNIATNPVGSAFNALGNGLASVISTNSDVQASVQPHAGLNAFAPLVGRGEVSFGVGNGPEFVWAFRGENEFKEPIKDLRLIVRGNYISASGAVVRQDSGITKVADLKGKQVTSDFPGSYIGKAILEATLVSNGLTWDDVKKVPTPTITAGIESLQDKRVEAAFALVPSSPVIQEAHNAVGLHALHFLDDYSPSQINEVPQEILDKIQANVPTARMTTVAPNGYVQEEVVAIEYPSVMAGSSHLPDENVYDVLETLWAHYEELHPVHAWFKSWSPEQMFDPNPSIPYHPAAVQFFKDKGLWNDDVEKVQQELLEYATS